MHHRPKKQTHVPENALTLYEQLKEMPEIRQMQNYIAHRNTSVYAHSIGVTNVSMWLATKFRLKPFRLPDLILAAMLHDFYLYDYHGRRIRDGWHAWRHPVRALENADALFQLKPQVRNAIRTHMFPGTLFHMPVYAIGWIIVIADKICAIAELLGSARMQRMRFSSCPAC